MSEGRVLSTRTIYVKLLGEGTDVLRPVIATYQGDNRFRILEQEVPSEEDWEFLPGEIVAVEVRETSSGKVDVCVSPTGP